MNRASVDQNLELSCTVLSRAFPQQLRTLLSPQHGLWSEQQANMIESGHSSLLSSGTPVFSLYSETRRPTDQMLRGIDCLVVDLQDVGTRVYTFIWTMLYCLQECGARQIPVIVLDRPNPLGGNLAEGPLLLPEFRSFVGEASIPMRHGLTIGELARWFNRALQLHCDLTVIPLQGWIRSMQFEHTQRVWVPPSPNMPTVQTAFVYPGQVLLEGTNLSEGRGTTTPFEIVGAPFIDPERYAAALNELPLPGVRCLPLRFCPSFDKLQGQSCGGVSIHVMDRSQFRPFLMTLEILRLTRRLYGDRLSWNPPPYEYEHRLLPIDILNGSPALRLGVDSEARDPHLSLDEPAWWDLVAEDLLYPHGD